MTAHRSSLLAGARVWVPLYLVLAFATGFVDLRVRAYPEHPVREYIPEIVSGTAGAPGKYRVLAPWLFELTERATGVEPMYVWHGMRLAWILAAVVLTHAYLRTWFAVAPAMLGTTLMLALLPLTFTNSWAHPDHMPELAFVALGCLAAARQANGFFCLALVLAAFNRETSVFLVVLFWITHALDRRHLIWSGVVAALWTLVYVGLRLVLGLSTYDPWQVWQNIEFLKLLPPPYDPYYRAYAWFGLILFGPLLYLAALSRSRQPLFVRRAVLVVPVIGIVGFLFSSLVETRIFTPALPMILPAALWTLAGPDRLDGV